MTVVKENQFYTHRSLGGIWLFHHADWGISFEWIVEPDHPMWKDFLKEYWLKRGFLDENDGSTEEGYYFKPVFTCEDCLKNKIPCMNMCMT